MGLVHLSSSVHKRLDFSVLSLYNLSHCLVEEVLCGVSPSSALGSGLVLTLELPLAHWHLILGSPWNLETAINNWINLMVDDIIMAVFIDLLLSCWHCRLSSLHSGHLREVFLVKARFLWLESERILLLEWINIEW